MLAWAGTFAKGIKPPAVIALSGELGTGKTTLVRAIAAALGVKGPVTSPTFALVHRYGGDGLRVYHVDAYRLKPREEVRDLGFADMLADPSAVIMVEWPERLGASAPDFTHHIRLSYAGEAGSRLVELA